MSSAVDLLQYQMDTERSVHTQQLQTASASGSMIDEYRGEIEQLRQSIADKDVLLEKQQSALEER